MKETRIQDVKELLEKATAAELLQLADFLDEHEWDHILKADKLTPAMREQILLETSEPGMAEEVTDTRLKRLGHVYAADALGGALWWQYQTFLGYMVRTPSYDAMTKSVMKQLKMGGAYKATRSCWDNQARLCAYLVDQLIDALPSEQQAQAIKELMGEKSAESIEKEIGVSIAKMASGGSAIWIGRLSYPVLRNLLLRLVHGVARATLGRGLTYAAGKKVLAVIAKRTAIIGFLAGPIGWLLLVWGLNDLTGTNYKKVLPAMLFIYTIHLRVNAKSESVKALAC